MDLNFESVYEKNKLSNVCRTCLTKDVEMFSVFQRYKDDSLNVHEIIMDFCSIEIKPEDGLPDQICVPCIVDAKNAFSFKNKCEKSQSTLQKYQRWFQIDQVDMILKEESNHSSFSEYSFKSNNENVKFDGDNIVCKISKKRINIDDDLRDASILSDFDIDKVKQEDPDSVVSCLIKKDDEYLIQSDDFEKLTRSLKLKDKRTHTKCHLKKRKSKSSCQSNPKKSVKRKSIIRYCEYCGFKTKLPSQLIKHMHIHTGEKPLACDLCDFRCVQSSSLHNHKLVHSNEKPYICTFCEYKSTNSSNLKRHMRRHTGDKPYCCDVCPYRCVQSSYLEEHRRTHTGEKPYLCDQCHYTCGSRSSLKTHKRNKHLIEKKFSCDKCDFRAKSKSTLIAHIKTHTGEKRFACDICPYRSIQLVTLENHKRMVHTGERPFPCDQCSYRGVSAGYLKSHQKSHQSMKMFSCDDCGYTCHTKFKLKSHKRTHTGEKPYHCTFCEFKSASSSSLRRHHKRNHSPVLK